MHVRSWCTFDYSGQSAAKQLTDVGKHECRVLIQRNSNDYVTDVDKLQGDDQCIEVKGSPSKIANIKSTSCSYLVATCAVIEWNNFQQPTATSMHSTWT